jgi:hypothetical protein
VSTVASPWEQVEDDFGVIPGCVDWGTPSAQYLNTPLPAWIARVGTCCWNWELKWDTATIATHLQIEILRPEMLPVVQQLTRTNRVKPSLPDFRALAFWSPVSYYILPQNPSEPCSGKTGDFRVLWTSHFETYELHFVGPWCMWSITFLQEPQKVGFGITVS